MHGQHLPLVGTLDREGGAIGVFITLENATSHMTDETASADIGGVRGCGVGGFYAPCRSA